MYQSLYNSCVNPTFVMFSNSGIFIGQLSRNAETQPRSGSSLDSLALGILNITSLDFGTLFAFRSAENSGFHGVLSIFDQVCTNSNNDIREHVIKFTVVHCLKVSNHSHCGPLGIRGRGEPSFSLRPNWS